MNRDLLMSSAAHFRIDYEINPYMDMSCQPDVKAALVEHEALSAAHRAAGRTVRVMESAPECPDMVYTANGAFVCDQRALLGAPPAARQEEIPYFRSALKESGFDVFDAPYPFSGQGDALACGRFLLAGYGRRTDRRIHAFIAELFGHEMVPLQTASDQWYDLDLAVAVIDGRTLAYHPQALAAPSRGRLRDLGLDLIEVGAQEARAFALNLISDGTTVTMTVGAPRLAATLRERGLTVAELDTTQLRKGGGGIRCTALTLDNPAPADASPFPLS
ncbi:amidinotransferase [Streptomyces sp. NBC_01283]|uniref:dimethylarginine dimethylaminohydrolase family protein n=1 Tax=Streptomyces sp. NBC_01283 TaxID=2903812 RepID=UPI00352D3179|nr:amidinotransferase [Streptomyces sp. NBC_01283]WSL21387.1 amidinotransferase [Streptomyces sp. NBC_01283]